MADKPLSPAMARVLRYAQRPVATRSRNFTAATATVQALYRRDMLTVSPWSTTPAGDAALAAYDAAALAVEHGEGTWHD